MQDERQTNYDVYSLQITSYHYAGKIFIANMISTLLSRSDMHSKENAEAEIISYVLGMLRFKSHTIEELPALKKMTNGE